MVSTLASTPAKAQFSFDDLSSLNLLLGDSVAGAFVRTIGMAIDHKPYEPATPLGMAIGLDISFDVTVFSVPQDFKDALTAIGSNAGNSIPVIPMGRLHVHKGIGDSFNLGVSYLGYLGYSVIGADLSYAIYHPDQGLTWAMRVAYAYGSVSYVKTHVITPQILASRRMSFADPYIGVGYQIITGEVSVPIQVGPATIEQTASSSSGNLLAFLGVGMRLGPTGLKLTLEGSYSAGGAHGLGMKFGLSF